MKRTLILFFFLCITFFVEAKIDTVYTEQNSLITRQVLETPNEVVVLEEYSFKNTTPYNFTDQEIQSLLSGGTIKKSLGLKKMATLFPPRFVEVSDIISLENGVTQTDTQSSPPKFEWSFLVFLMGLPVIMMLVLSLNVPSDKKKQLILLFFILIAVAIAGVTAVVADAITAVYLTWCAVFVIVAGVTVVAFFAGISSALVVIVFTVIVVFLTYTYRNISFAGQYITFIGVSCLLSYGIRQLWFRSKEKKLAQA